MSPEVICQEKTTEACSMLLILDKKIERLEENIFKIFNGQDTITRALDLHMEREETTMHTSTTLIKDLVSRMEALFGLIHKNAST